MTKEKTVQNDLYRGCYGPRLKPSEVKQWLFDCLNDNFNRQVGRFTLDLWGAPGVGKSFIVKEMAHVPVEYKGKQYDGFKIIDLPLAQIEEMGDLLGLPSEKMLIKKDQEQKWILTTNSVVNYYFNNGWEPVEDVAPVTVNSPQSWVPKEDIPGIILFDDGNRASQRIMKGLMQLVQDYKTISWELPPGWTIVFTGNPDNRFNQVTAMDSAQLTRMKHVTLETDAQDWSEWAVKNKLDPRGINFILKYPEMMIGKERTNPRTLSEFFYILKKYPNLDGANIKNILRDARSLLDEETVDTMMVFFKRDLELIIDPKMILEDFDQAAQELKQLMERDEPRVDIVNIVADRLLACICSSCYQFKAEHVKSVQDWLLHENLPRDCSYGFLKSLLFSDAKHKKEFCSNNPELLKMLTFAADYQVKQ